MTEPAATPLVTSDDVAARLGGDWSSSAEEDQADALCADVSELIRALRPQIDTWMAAGRVRRGVVVAIGAQAVARALSSASSGGIPIVGESHPEYSVQYSQVARAGLRLEPEELRAITPPDETSAASKAFSVKPAM